MNSGERKVVSTFVGISIMQYAAATTKVMSSQERLCRSSRFNAIHLSADSLNAEPAAVFRTAFFLPELSAPDCPLMVSMTETRFTLPSIRLQTAISAR